MDKLDVLLPIVTLVIGFLLNTVKDYFDRKVSNNELLRKEKIDLYMKISKVRKNMLDEVSNIIESSTTSINRTRLDSLKDNLKSNVSTTRELMFHMDLYYSSNDKMKYKINKNYMKGAELFDDATSESYNVNTSQNIHTNIEQSTKSMILVLDGMSLIISDDLNK